MIIGNGLIAKSFKDSFEKSNNIIIFASGVSNSNETNPKNFEREKATLMESLDERKKLIYFSTCSIQETNVQHSMYIKHKISMEKIIRKSPNYLIFRLPQIVGNTKNFNTLTNFLYKKISNHDSFNIFQNCERNIIDVADVSKIVSFIINSGTNKRTIYIANPKSIQVLDLVRIFERVLGIQAIYNLIEFGESYNIDTKYCLKIANNLDINFEDDKDKELFELYNDIFTPISINEVDYEIDSSEINSNKDFFTNNMFFKQITDESREELLDNHYSL
jgi:hypothetical protein